MPSFKMTVRNRGDATDNGLEIKAPDVDAARARTLHLARDLLADLIRRDIAISAYTFDISENGFLVKSVTAAEVLGLAA
jgi:hypothetical protein